MTKRTALFQLYFTQTCIPLYCGRYAPLFWTKNTEFADKKTLQAWTGHPHLTICPNVNGESFEQKIDRALRAVHKTVGL